MMFKVQTQRPLDLYRLMRDGLIEDAKRLDKLEFDLWEVLPRGMSGNRLQTATMLRKLANNMTREFPGGIHHRKGKVQFTKDFIDFAHTHKEMGTDEGDVVKAWAAMQSIVA